MGKSGPLQFYAPVIGVVMFLTFATPSSAQLCGSGTGVCVLTWQNDAYRTGDNLQETTLTYNSLNKNTFGQLCSLQLDGQVYGQPLVVTNVTINGTTYPSVIYVVTENDSIYAINGTPQPSGNTCQIIPGLGPVSLLNGNFQGQPTMSAVDCHNIGNMQNCPTIAPIVGVVGTPVIHIDTTSNTGTLYVVAEMQSGSPPNVIFYHFLHALDITTLAEGVGNEQAGAPIWICHGGCRKYTSSSAFSQTHIQRPGLLFANCGSGCGNYVYVAFSMMDDSGYPFPNGAIWGYKAADLTTGAFYFQTSDGHGEQASNGGGIWQGGSAPAFGTDSSGSSWIYLNTANGTWDGSSNWGDSLLKLNPNGLTVASNGFFTAADQYYRSAHNIQGCEGDEDFGSGGVMLIPDSEVSNYPYLTVSGEKEGYIWFLDRTTPGGHITTCDSTCSCTATETHVVQKYDTQQTYGFHNNLAYWETTSSNVLNNYIYGMTFGGGPLVQYTLCVAPSTPPPTTVVCGSLSATDGSGNPIDMKTAYGSTPTISATAPETATDAIVWVLVKPDGNLPAGTTHGILYAFDAMSMRELYDSNVCASDNISPATKFSVPTVANKYVYLGTEQAVNGTNTGLGMFYIFGTRTTCS
jgi:hypothetical protein